MDSWRDVLDRVLRPARPRLAECLRAREEHVSDRRPVVEARRRALADCEARIENARAAVFAAKDGVVRSNMTELEREWRRLSRADIDGEVMHLWARIAPREWIDRKLWRGSHRELFVDAAIALASDVDGVEAAEAAARSLSSGPRIVFRLGADDAACTKDLFVVDLDGLSASAAERARRLEQQVLDDALVRFPERPLLAADIARAAFVDCVARATGALSPVAPLRALWTTGYVLSAIDASGVTIAIPPL